MAFWLARARSGQDHDWIQRFDPRFWTVNFPRPMMAAATVTAPDALRIDLAFLTRGDLAGVIWESADRYDHPLLAYATDRDYARTTLSFRWRSAGVVPLDAGQGPTLTIEGRDAAGSPRTISGVRSSMRPIFRRSWDFWSGTKTPRVGSYFSAMEKWVGLVMTTVADGTACIIRWRERLRPIWRIFPLILGSPSCSLCSSFISLSDIMFFLLLFFLIISTVTNPNVIKVMLPQSKASQSLNKQPVILTITENRQFYINKRPVSQAELEDGLVKACANLDEPTVVLHAANSLTIQDLVDVMQIGSEHKIKMVLATKQK